MKFEFNQGVPEGCVQWLRENVGPGNIEGAWPKGGIARRGMIDKPEYAWFYERVEIEIESTNDNEDSNTKYVPTIIVKDTKLAMLFALRWS